MQAAYGVGGESEGQLRDQLTRKFANVEENYRVSLTGGSIDGWASIWHPEPTSERIFLDVRAHPRELATYERLVDWAEQRASALAAGRTVRAHIGTVSNNELLASEVQRRGYELVRHFFTMEIDLAEKPPAPSWPDGITVRTYRPGDERPVYDADMEAFEDHWDFFTVPFEEWVEYFIGSSEFDPGLVFIAEEDDELVGFSLCRNEVRPNTGHVGVLGVRRPWRRRGLGTALLLHSFHEFRNRGRAKADLGV
ncbi:MAG: GNAT family N-acetyltransferase, partial [Actinobacteria bacterium]|nr:GNAT family N-acetyltransferase [Actinomycetota bacterium]